jgi:hypothetical protein
VGIFLCPAAGVKSNWKNRFIADISNRPRYIVGCPYGTKVPPKFRDEPYLARGVPP